MSPGQRPDERFCAFGVSASTELRRMKGQPVVAAGGVLVRRAHRRRGHGALVRGNERSSRRSVPPAAAAVSTPRLVSNERLVCNR